MVVRAQPRAGILRTALVDGQVAGVGAHMLARMVIGGEERRVSFSCHAVTSPAASGRGIFTELQRAHDQAAEEQGLEVVLGFGNARDEPGVLRPARLVGRARSYRIWARPVVAAGTRRGGRARRRGRRSDRAGGTTSSATGGTSLALRRLAAAVRAVRSDNGYAVVWPSKPLGSRTIAVLSDLVAPPSELPGLLRRAAGAARSRLLFGAAAHPASAALLARRVRCRRTGRCTSSARRSTGPLDLDPAALALHARRPDFF